MGWQIFFFLSSGAKSAGKEITIKDFLIDLLRVQYSAQ